VRFVTKNNLEFRSVWAGIRIGAAGRVTGPTQRKKAAIRIPKRSQRSRTIGILRMEDRVEDTMDGEVTRVLER
jgi:hypothetical protein